MGPLTARFAQGLAVSTPILTAISLIFLSLVPLRLPGDVFATPALALMPIYFWGLYRPDLMPPLAVFGIGVIQDFVTGGPIGLWAFIYLAVYGALLAQRQLIMARMSHRMWYGFSLTAIAAAIIAWVAGTIVYGQFLNPWPLASQAALSIALYPLIGRVLAMLHVRMQRELLG